jgi:hypothetical protein
MRALMHLREKKRGEERRGEERRGEERRGGEQEHMELIHQNLDYGNKPIFRWSSNFYQSCQGNSMGKEQPY